MRYEEYEKKIIKRARVRKAIYRFRFPIIIFSSAVILTTGGLVGTKGLVSEKETLLPEYHYGDTISYLSTAFISNASYEFSPLEQEEWKEDVPYLVGKYKMRSRGENSFNSYYYGKEQEFEIVPKEIVATVNEDSLTYGDIPTLKIDGLCYQDKFNDNYTMSYSDRTQSTWTITPDLNSIRIFASSGKDVTSNYKIKVQSKDLNILKRSITISTSSDNKIYDGTPLKNEGFNVISGSLVEGDSISVVSSSDIVNVGTTLNNQTFKVTTSDGLDMTSHYAIELKAGSLAIEKRKITVSSINHEYIYDGYDKRFDIKEVSITSGDGLANGEKIEFDYADSDLFINAGEYSNSFKTKIIRGDVDVSSNYDITSIFGKTTINKRNIAIKSDSESFTYDKKNHYVNTASLLNETTLADKDELIVNKYNKFVDSGEYKNDIEYSIVDKATGNDAISNYSINYTSGLITINKVDLTISLVKQKVVYDGKPHQNSHTIKEGELVEGDKIEVTVSPEYTDVGVYDNENYEVIIKDENGLDNLKNYNLKYINREEAFEITKRPITIETISKEKLYDAEPISKSIEDDEVLYQINEGSLAENEYIKFEYKNNPVDSGKYPIQKELVIYHQLGEEKDIDNDKVVTSNYEITYVDGTFTINKRTISIETIDCEYKYNRETTLPADAKTFKVLDTGDGLVKGHKVKSLNITCDGINVGTYDYKIDESSLVIVDKDDNDVTKNYSPTFINSGKVKIVPRPVTVKLNDASKIYDGEPLKSEKYTQTGLLSGDYFKFEGLPSIIHVWEGPKDNDPTSMKIFMSNGDEVTSNYEITNKSNGKLEIKPRPITVESISIKKQFDGKETSRVKQFKIAGGSLAKNDRIEVNEMTSNDNVFYHVCDVDNVFTVSIYNKNDEDVTADYKIDYKYGKIQIEPCELQIQTFSTSITYDGKPHDVIYAEEEVNDSSENFFLSKGKIPEGYHLFCAFSALDLKYVNDSNHKYTTTITEEDPNYDVDNNDFSIEYTNFEFGTASIKQRSITLQTISGSKIYDEKAFGIDLTDEEYMWIAGGSLAEGDYIESFNRPEFIEVGDYENFISDLIIKNAEGKDVTYCYNINFNFGSVKIYEM